MKKDLTMKDPLSGLLSLCVCVCVCVCVLLVGRIRTSAIPEVAMIQDRKVNINFGTDEPLYCVSTQFYWPGFAENVASSSTENVFNQQPFSPTGKFFLFSSELEQRQQRANVFQGDWVETGRDSSFYITILPELPALNGAKAAHN